VVVSWKIDKEMD